MNISPVHQIHIARRHPLACALGALAGMVPAGVYRLGHYEITSWDPRHDSKAIVAYCGLAFSLLTVVGWAREVFSTPSAWASWIKAIGFTALIEALMLTSTSTWFNGACLVLLIAINAVANGTRLALRAAGPLPVRAGGYRVRSDVP